MKTRFHFLSRRTLRAGFAAICAGTLIAAQAYGGGFQVTPRATKAGPPVAGDLNDYRYDDGTRESALSLSGSGELCWIHHYDVAPGNERIVAIYTQWEDVANGTSARVFVWEDPNDDGNPNDAVLLRQQTVTVSNSNIGVFNEYQLSQPVAVKGAFFVGAAVIQQAGQLPCPVDTSSAYVAGRTWFVGDFQSFNPTTLMSNDVPPTDAGDVGAGYALLRASGEPRSGITYQGRLQQNGTPVNGVARLSFSLFDNLVGGTQVGATILLSNVVVADGRFTAQLPFDTEEFDGGTRWLEIAAAFPSNAPPVTLTPRQMITDAPYALHARTAESVELRDIVGIPAGFLDWVDDSNFGDITGVTAGPGLSGGGTTGAVTLSANFGGTGAATSVSRSDHFHNSLDASDGSPADVVFVDSLGNVGVGTLTPARRLHVANGVSGAASTSTADVVIEDDAAAFVHFLTPESVESGLLFGDTSNSISGGIIFNNPATTNGIQFRAGGNTTRMTLDGAGRLGIGITPTATLHVGGASGDGAVILPNSSINSTETFDEPGIASDSEGVTGVALTNSAQPLLSRSITTPTNGYVLVLGGCQATANHTNGTASLATFGVSSTPTNFPSNQDVLVSLPSTAASGSYSSAVAVHHVFTVAAGTHTFSFLAQENSGAWTANDMQLTLVYFATDYGVVSLAQVDGKSSEVAESGTAKAAKGDAQSSDEREQVRAEIKELRQLKAELQMLKAQLQPGIRATK